MLDVLTTLVNFSYKGDIRMRWKMENPDKVKNLVIGSFKPLVEMYTPFLAELESQGILQTIKSDDGLISHLVFTHKAPNL